MLTTKGKVIVAVYKVENAAQLLELVSVDVGAERPVCIWARNLALACFSGGNRP